MKATKTIRNIFSLWVLVSMVMLTACSVDGSQTVSDSARSLKSCGVIHEPEFGGIYIKTTIDDFNALGYHYGDSVSITFSNGFTLDDIPYYNGYYTHVGDPLLIAYPNYDYIKAAINCGDDLWDVAKLSENDTASISLVQAGKYKDIQAARDITYKDDRSAYGSDEVFANFRNIKIGKIKEKMLPAIRKNEFIGKIPYFETDIYKLSRKLKAMQYLENEGVLRCWYDKDTRSYEIIKDSESYLL